MRRHQTDIYLRTLTAVDEYFGYCRNVQILSLRVCFLSQNIWSLVWCVFFYANFVHIFCWISNAISNYWQLNSSSLMPSTNTGSMFQQDEAFLHSTVEILHLLRSHYDNRVIGRDAPNRFTFGLFWLTWLNTASLIFMGLC